MKLKNITKDKISTSAGVILFILAGLNFLGYVKFPGQSWCSPQIQCGITAAVGAVLAFVDLKTIKEKVTAFFVKRADKISNE